MERVPAQAIRPADGPFPPMRRALWIAALLTLYTGWDYFRAGARHLIGDEA